MWIFEQETNVYHNTYIDTGDSLTIDLRGEVYCRGDYWHFKIFRHESLVRDMSSPYWKTPEDAQKACDKESSRIGHK